MALQSFINKSLDWFCSNISQRSMQCKTLGSSDAPMRLLIVANALIPTVQLSLVYPLQVELESNQCTIDFITEHDMKQKFGKKLYTIEVATWVKNQLFAKCFTHIIFCRYSGPHYEEMLSVAKSQHIPTIYCIDDDLLNVPVELGKQKHEYHNHPLRLGAVRYLLDNVDLIYCSNERLKLHLQDLGVQGKFHISKIFCAGKIISPVEQRPTNLIGYMGFDHAHDFEIVLPAIIKILSEYPLLRFELFGKIPKPQILDQFGDRVTVIPVVTDYSAFLQQLAARRWDIGICPLAPTAFNRVKNINKWIEYTSVGAAVIASRGMIYDDCCADESGYLVRDDEWYIAFDNLLKNPEKKFKQVANAQKKLVDMYSIEKLKDQLISMLQAASNLHEINI